MQLISFFSGIGGFEVAAECMGWKIISSCEINPFGRQVLKYYWPEAYHHDDVKTVDYEQIKKRLNPNDPTIFVAGFPCQPFSAAGKRKGKEDDRYGWPDCLTAVRQLRPSYCVFENVSGLVNWSGGMVFDEVQTDLEAEGYEVTPFLLPACGKDAPHRRERIWFIGYSESFNATRSRRCNNRERQGNKEIGAGLFDQFGSDGTNGDATNTEDENDRLSIRKEPKHSQLRKHGFNEYVTNTKEQRFQKWDAEQAWNRTHPTIERYDSVYGWQNFPTQPPLRERNDGFSRRLLRYLTKDVIDEISNTSKENRIENLSEVWGRISKEEVWQQVRRFYSLESKDILFQTMQLYTTGNNTQSILSPFSEKFSEPILSHLRKYGEFRCSPQGQELEKQRAIESGNDMPYLPHEVALAARRFETAASKFETWHRNESIKAYGNAIVPAVAYEIFKAIQKMENNGT